MTDAETADRLVHRRARMMPAMAAIFIAQQGSYFSGRRLGEGSRLVDHVAISAWLVLSIVLLMAFATGGGWFRSAKVRALINDESARIHRAEGFRIGFLAMMIAAIALYILSLFEPVSGRDAIHVLMSAGIAAALIRFGMLERRALNP
ncbi:MAG: hypothetical protein ACTHJR_14760 [Sphingomonas sp.]|uniref:hypothetical protein n=1 Tax=Sphingomonas sp. TaxID=28214 RepID=UPI003F7E0CD4